VAVRAAADLRDLRAAVPVIGHLDGCARGRWLLEQPRALAGLLWALVFREGPACTCADLEDYDEGDAVRARLNGR
jgi:hypothetical protein